MITKYTLEFTGYVLFDDETGDPHPEELSLEELLNAYPVQDSNYVLTEEENG
tara:strand:- start:210 stop:365 length:156 start_codon:yes stop_codon:yes gene_type:complete